MDNTNPSKKKIVMSQEQPVNTLSDMAFSEMYRSPTSFAGLNRLILRDLNSGASSSAFSLYSRDDITSYLQNPQSNEKQIRDAIIYIYGASSHFRRLIQYFASLSDLSYVVTPFNIDVSKAKPASIKRNYDKTMATLSALDIKRQFAKVLTVCIREDVFYGTMWVSSDSIIIQQLPPDYCQTNVIEDNVLNVSFDFSYFDTNAKYLDMYPAEFKQKYQAYQKDRMNKKWQELDAPTSWAVKCNDDILSYALPPFVGILREIYDIEDYKQLKKAYTELQNYAMLVMKLGVNTDGTWQMDLPKAKEFWRNLDEVLPDQIGSVLSPMPIEKISFERNRTTESDTIAEAEQNMFSAAGVSSLLFNNPKASANALSLSIKADQAFTYRIVKNIEGVINRFLRAQSYGKNFKVTFLDCSPYNRKECGDAYLKASQYGIPMISYYAASQGLSQDEMDYMNFLERDVLAFTDRFKPLQSSATLSGDSTDDAGRPTMSDDELSEAGETSRERGES